MEKMNTPFSDAVGKDVPMTPSGPATTGSESGYKGSSGGEFAPQVIRDNAVTPKSPGWVDIKDPNYHWK